MSASDEFPRGWQIESDTTGISASVVIPAAPNVSHVVTDMYAKAVWQPSATPSAVGLLIQLQKTSGTIDLGFVYLTAAVALPDDISFTGKIQCAVGEAVTLTFLGTPPGVNNMVRMQGYDI